MAMMNLEEFALQYNGTLYTYNHKARLWKTNGEVLWYSNIPDEVRQMREKLMDAVSEGV